MRGVLAKVAADLAQQYRWSLRRTMERHCAALLIITSVVVAAVGTSPLLSAHVFAQQPDIKGPTLPVTTRKDFRCIAAAAQQIVDHRGKPGKHTLYISRFAVDDPSFVRVYWPRDGSIIILFLDNLSCTQSGGPIDDDFLWWYDRKARIDLKTDIVPNDEDKHGSSYLVDKPWAEAVISDCKRNRYKLTVVRSHGR